MKMINRGWEQMDADQNEFQAVHTPGEPANRQIPFKSVFHPWLNCGF